MPREPIRSPTVPAPPARFRLMLQLGLALGPVVVLFVLPPCASPPLLDLTAVAALGLWVGWLLVRVLGGPHRAASPLGFPPRAAAGPGNVSGGGDDGS